VRSPARIVLDERKADIRSCIHHFNVPENPGSLAMNRPSRRMMLNSDAVFLAFLCPDLGQAVSPSRTVTVDDRHLVVRNPPAGFLNRSVKSWKIFPVTGTRDKNPQSITGRPLRNRSTSCL
jgi:hypothetical protein